MIDLRAILVADALTPGEVGAFATPESRWISVDSALVLIEALHPASRSSIDSDSVPGFGGSSSGDAGGSTSEAPEPRGGVTAVERPTSGVLPPDPVRQPLLGAGSGPSQRTASPA